MIEQWLKELGFGKNDIKVYLSFYEIIGPVKAGAIIKATKLHPNLVYRSLEELLEKKLIIRIEKEGVFYFEITDPNAIKDLVERKVQMAELLFTALQNKRNGANRNLRILEGLEGIKIIHEKSLELPKGETVFVLGGSKLTQTPEMERYWDSYHDKRIAKGINFKILYDRTVPNIRVNKRVVQALSEAKYLPFDFDLPTWFEFFGDSVIIGVPGIEPLMFSFNSKEVVDSFRKFFDFLWNREEKSK